VHSELSRQLCDSGRMMARIVRALAVAQQV